MLPNNRKVKNRQKKVVQLIALFVLAAGVSVFGGYLFVSQGKNDAPLISPLAQGVLGEAVFEEESEVNYLKEQLAKQKIDLKSVVASGSSYHIFLTDGSEVLFSSQKSIDSQISSLQFITLRLTMEGRRFHRLDLRFEKPIVVF